VVQSIYEVFAEEEELVRIGVLSDTHLQRTSPELSRLVVDGPFADVDMIFHAGDIVRMDVLDALAPKEVMAVRGNMDDGGVAARLPEKRVIQVEGFSIALVHGWGSRVGLEQRIRETFTGVDAICYGHSHATANHVVAGVLLFNPGSFYNQTVGILTVDQSIRGEIINL